MKKKKKGKKNKQLNVPLIPKDPNSYKVKQVGQNHFLVVPNKTDEKKNIKKNTQQLGVTTKKNKTKNKNNKNLIDNSIAPMCNEQLGQRVKINVMKNPFNSQVKSPREIFTSQVKSHQVAKTKDAVRKYYEIEESIKPTEKQSQVNSNGLSTVSTVNQLGYSLQLGREARWKILRKVIIPKLGREKVIKHLKFLIKMNKGQAAKANAVGEWQYDLRRIESNK